MLITAFICSRILSPNSDFNLLKYLETHAGDKSAKTTSFRKSIIELIKELIQKYTTNCLDYLHYLKEKSYVVFLTEQSLVVKEKLCSLIAKQIEIFDIEHTDKIYEPKRFIENLLDEIKLKKHPPSVKGSIWHIIGILIYKFSMKLDKYKYEVNDVIFCELCELHENKKKFEMKAISGILKALDYLLEDCRLEKKQIEKLYAFLKAMINPLEDTNSIKINKLSLNVLSHHGKVFYSEIQKDSIFIFDLIFKLCNHRNVELKNAAHEAIELIAKHISFCLNEDLSIHKNSFSYIILQISKVLEDKTGGVMLNTAITLSKYTIHNIFHIYY